MKEEDIYKPQNIKRTEEVFSPSKKFKLEILYYFTKEGCWEYSRGKIYRVLDNKIIADIKRNYSTFHHSFQTKNSQEYLITGRSYMGQTIVNLDEEWEVSTPGPYGGQEFCWADHFLSPDGQTLAVAGCHWAGPYEIAFFDFSNPKVLPLPVLMQDDDTWYDKTYGWTDKGFKWARGHELFVPWSKRDRDLTLEELEQISKEFGDEDDDKLWKWVDDEVWLCHREGDTVLVRKIES